MIKLHLIAPEEDTTRPVIVVHGFGFDPNGSWGNKPGSVFFPYFRDNIFPQRDIVGYGYYSVPTGLRGLLRSWGSGRWNRYRHAWDLAEKQGFLLRVAIQQCGGEVDLVGHSLGSRVIASALSWDGVLPVKRVLLLNGAEHTSRWQKALKWSGTNSIQFMNVCVKSDDVLHKLGALLSPGRLYEPCVGRMGLGASAPRRWVDVRLDSPYTQEWGRAQGYRLEGDNPYRYSDHWYSYNYAGNWPIYRDWLSGGLAIG